MTNSLTVNVIQTKDELEQLSPFYVDNLLWGTKKIPKTYGYLGLVPGDGFYFKMVCEESDPVRTFTGANEPVYRDSAMEAFFRFEPVKVGIRGAVYLNFEFNANGALLAGYGNGRIYRTFFGEEERAKFECEAKVEDDKWWVSLRIPEEILTMIYGPLDLTEGSTFWCNFYKISEKKEIEHYASYEPVLSQEPDFHQPQFFAEARIVNGDAV